MHKRAEESLDDACAEIVAWILGWIAVAFVIGLAAFLLSPL